VNKGLAMSRKLESVVRRIENDSAARERDAQADSARSPHEARDVVLRVAITSQLRSRGPRRAFPQNKARSKKEVLSIT
jgi:hypothetical protein